jgi:hypothetical protein
LPDRIGFNRYFFCFAKNTTGSSPFAGKHKIGEKGLVPIFIRRQKMKKIQKNSKKLSKKC